MPGHNILVIGGAGYIGSHMVKELLRADYNVITLDNLSTGHREMLSGGIFVHGELGDTALLNKIFTQFRIDAVMNFAACALVEESVRDPLKYYRNNVAGTTELLNVMIRHDVKRFVFSSSCTVYGEPVSIPIAEDHPRNPVNPYGHTKNAVEYLMESCSSAYDLRYVSLRYFNVAGADVSGNLGERHDPETHLIPIILRTAAGQLDHIDLRGTDYPTIDGTCIRDYVHVGDLARAHLLALEYLLNGGQSTVYNVGNSKGYSNREVIEAARKVTGMPIPVVEKDRRPGDPAILVANSDKIRKELNWKPRFESLETIIETAWAWHRKEAGLPETANRSREEQDNFLRCLFLQIPAFAAIRSLRRKRNHPV